MSASNPPPESLRDNPVLKRLKWLAREAAPGAGAATVCEGLAAGFGFGTHAALLEVFRDGWEVEFLEFDPEAFQRRLAELGHPVRLEDPDTLEERMDEALEFGLPGRQVSMHAIARTHASTPVHPCGCRGNLHGTTIFYRIREQCTLSSAD